MAQQYGNSSNITVKMEGPFGSGGGGAIKLIELTLNANSWKGASSPYSQVVIADGASINSMINLEPSAQQIETMRENGVAFSAENDGGEVTVYAFGEKPTVSYTIQASILEVVA